jgi:hypothetical protein
MKQIAYGGGSLVTGDDIADALLDLSAALANSGRAMRIEVPAIDGDHNPETVSVVIGPASQMIGETVLLGDEITDERFVQNARRIIDELTSVTPQPFSAEQGPNTFT